MEPVDQLASLGAQYVLFVNSAVCPAWVTRDAVTMSNSDFQGLPGDMGPQGNNGSEGLQGVMVSKLEQTCHVRLLYYDNCLQEVITKREVWIRTNLTCGSCYH